ncbi:tumor necrosis factor receptor superfamily member 14-like [Scyliorhinus canicula]|uniref:tumor necrosis factor receptor superfamily member 14-like n=1 Tax=Scyliorhinus canicula TaxID=7830 RepID=UPI0018F3087C|nr:tumor necrosis factor receptor superfamily member 14-like [Scyliorhinus canicula]
MCKPGLRVGEHCTQHSGTQCQPCQNKTYQDHFNGDERCKACKSCGEGMFPMKECENTYDTVCDCSEGYHCDNITEDGCDQCTRHSNCGPGEEVVRRGAYRKDTLCRPQPSGRPFTGETSSTPSVDESKASETGCPHDGTFNVAALVLGLLAPVIIVFLKWKSIIKAIQACSKVTNGVVNQQPVQEQGSTDYLCVSVEEASSGTVHFANCKQTNELALNEKDESA